MTSSKSTTVEFEIRTTNINPFLKAVEKARLSKISSFELAEDMIEIPNTETAQLEEIIIYTLKTKGYNLTSKEITKEIKKQKPNLENHEVLQKLRKLTDEEKIQRTYDGTQYRYCTN